MKIKTLSRADKSPLSLWWWTLDRSLLFAFLALYLIGVIMVTTASPQVAEYLDLGYYHFLFKHLVFMAGSLVCFFAVSSMDSRTIWRVASLLFVGAAILMVVVLLSGDEVKGAKRWIRLFGFTIQPSEFIKPAFLILAAWAMALQKQKESFKGNLLAILFYALTVFLLLQQPDFGMTVIVTASWVVQICLAGFPLKIMVLLAAMAICGGVMAYYAFDHVRSRFDRFFDPDSGDTHQVNKSLEAFESGGFWGVGPGQGEVKLSLPDGHADFIFSVMGEEMGLIFVILFIALIAFVVLRGFSVLSRSNDIFAILAAGGLLAMFGFQAFVHMGSALNMLPAKGMTLPFVSYGGSSLVSMGIAMGAVLALTRKGKTGSIAKAGLYLGGRQ